MQKRKKNTPQLSFHKQYMIIGKKIKLEKTSFSHAEQLFKQIQTPGVLKNLTITIENEEEYHDYIRFVEHQWKLNTDFTYTIIKIPNQILGQISLYDVSFNHRRAEVGIWLGNMYQQKGFGTRALKLIIEYGFKQLNLNRLQAHMFLTNVGSQKIFEKLGFKQEGIHQEYVKKDTDFLDVYCYALLKQNWNAI